MKRKTILTKLTALLIVLSVLFSVLTACNNTQEETKDNTPEFSGVFSAEDGKFYMDSGDVFTTEDGELSLSITAILTEEYYNELKSTYGNACEVSFYATAGKIVEDKPEIFAENKISSKPIEFAIENEKSIYKAIGSVIINDYNFTATEYFAFFDEGYFGQMFLAIKYEKNSKIVYDKITTFDTENFENYSDRATDIKISQFNVFNFMMPTNKNFILMEDVDLSKINYAATDKTFSGVLDGQGNAIKNLKPNARYGGLFNTLGEGAEIKNVAFIDADLSFGEISGIFGQTNKDVKFSDVFVMVSSSFLGTGTGLIGEVFGGKQTYENVFIYSKATGSSAKEKTGLLVGRSYRSNVVYLTNCHFVADFSCYNSNNDGLFGDDYKGTYNEPDFKKKNYKTYTNISNVNLGEGSTLTDFMKSCINKYINN